MSPAWLLDILAALMLVVAAVSATCLATARLPANRLSAAEPTGSRSSPCGSSGADTDIAHLLMCIAGFDTLKRRSLANLGMNLGILSDAADLLRPPLLPARCDSARSLALSALHVEL